MATHSTEAMTKTATQYPYRYQRHYSGRLQAVIFDWAGTLVDFGSFAPTQVLVDAFAAYGFHILKRISLRPIVTDSTNDNFKSVFTGLPQRSGAEMVRALADFPYGLRGAVGVSQRFGMAGIALSLPEDYVERITQCKIGWTF